MGKKFVLLFFACILSTAFFVSCGRKAEPDANGEGTSAAQSAQDEIEPEANLSPEVQAVVSAIETVSNLESFQLDTKARLELNGKSINDEYNMQSEIHVVQGKDRQNMQMTMVSSSDIDDVISRAYYKEGWYYTDDKNGQNKVEKSPDEVMKIVSDVTALVIDASEQIEEVQVEQDGSSQIYSYQIPAYLAEDYLGKLTKSAAAEDTALENAKTDVEEVWLVSTVNADGVLTQQKLSISGLIRKAIFKVPAKAEITAKFTETGEKELDMELW